MAVPLPLCRHWMQNHHGRLALFGSTCFLLQFWRRTQISTRKPTKLFSDLQDEQMPLCFEFQGFSGDATNSNIVQSSKVHTCVVRSAYLVPHVREGQEGWAILQRQSLADVQLLPDSVTGAVIYQMYQKQLRSRVT